MKFVLKTLKNIKLRKNFKKKNYSFFLNTPKINPWIKKNFV